MNHLGVRDKVSHPYTTKTKIIVSYVLMFRSNAYISKFLIFNHRRFLGNVSTMMVYKIIRSQDLNSDDEQLPNSQKFLNFIFDLR
jgi:hypothetical protein